MSTAKWHALEVLAPATLSKVLVRGRYGSWIHSVYVLSLCAVYLVIAFAATHANWPGVLLWLLCFYISTVGASGYGVFGTRRDLSRTPNRVFLRIWRGLFGFFAICLLAFGFAPSRMERSASGAVVLLKQYFSIEVPPLVFVAYLVALVVLALTVVWVTVLESVDS